MEEELSLEEAIVRLRDYEWLERCMAPVLSADDIWSLMESVRDLFQERFPLDRFGIMVGTLNDRYCVIHELVTRDDLTPVPPGSLMVVQDTGLERIYSTGESHYNPDITVHPEFLEDPELAEIGVRSIARLPLIARGRVFGVMTVKCGIVDAYSPANVELMKLAARRLASNIYNLKLIDSLQEAAYKDGLTNTFNRRFLTEAIENAQTAHVEQLTGQHFEGDTPVFVLFVDLNDLKAVNDTYGHVVGDDHLQSVAHHLKSVTGDEGIIVRYGGDEFVVILPEFEEAAAKRIADAFTAKSLNLHSLEPNHGDEALPNSDQDEQGPVCSFSVGMAKGVWQDVRELVRVADRDMYRDKGRPSGGSGR